MADTSGKPSSLLGWVEGRATSRLALFVAVAVYACTITAGHVLYLLPVRGYYGFTYAWPDLWDISLIATLLLSGSLLAPTEVNRPSSIILLLLFVIVYVPTVVITPSLSPDSSSRYFWLLAAFAVAFSLACAVPRLIPIEESRDGFVQPDHRFILGITAFWIICGAVLIYRYADIMRFVALDNDTVYDQRAAGRADTAVIAYVQTYFSNVFSPALIAMGLTRRRYWPLILLGFCGCIISYMINAQRTVFLVPFAMFGLYLALWVRTPLMRTSAFVLIFVSVVIAASTLSHPVLGDYSPLSNLLHFRTLSLPGLTLSQYYDLFRETGFTYWSHVKGISWFVPPPAAFQNDPLWPGLGYIMGDRIYGSSGNNHNANLFAGDGAAAAGILGVLVIGFALGLWLAFLDAVSNRWNRAFAILVSFPLGLSLTNAHFFTMLLSFGGIFWCAAFLFYRQNDILTFWRGSYGWKRPSP